jgi:hypothetical protein
MDEQATEMRTWLINWFNLNAAGASRSQGSDTELVLMAFNLNKLAWELAEKFDERAR